MEAVVERWWGINESNGEVKKSLRYCLYMYVWDLIDSPYHLVLITYSNTACTFAIFRASPRVAVSSVAQSPSRSKRKKREWKIIW